MANFNVGEQIGSADKQDPGAKGSEISEIIIGHYGSGLDGFR